MRSDRTHDYRRPIGAGLVETLIVIALLTILMALLLPQFRQVRRQSDDLRNLSNMRQTMIDFAGWSNDHNGTMVNAGLPETGEAEWFYGPGQSNYMARSMYRSQMHFWPRVLHRWAGESSEAWHATLGPSTLGGQVDGKLPAYSETSLWHTLPSRFVYSETMLTSSAVWRQWPQALSSDEFAVFYREVRFDEISSSANKGVLLFRANGAASTQWVVAFADGHAASYSPTMLRSPVSHPASPARAPGTPVLHTFEGSEGSDL